MNQDGAGAPAANGGSQSARRPLFGYLWAALASACLTVAAFLLGLYAGGSGGITTGVGVLIVAAIALAAAVISAGLAYRVFASPIKLVAEFLSRLADGKGDLSVRIPHGAPLPVRSLATGTNEFIRYLNDDLKELRAATTKFAVFSQDIASSSDKLSSSSEIQVHEMTDVSRTLERFNDTLQDINQQIETQVNNIDQTSDAIDELTNGISSIVDTSTSIQSQVSETVTSVEKSHDRISSSLEQSTNMHSVVSSLSDKMDRLAERSDEISQIVRVIQDISERTHVLATNASIQAAKAGEAGRGFAVVAEQVRELSKGTSKSVSEIDQLMRETVESIREATSQTQRVQTFTDEFRVSAGESDKALRQITTDIEAINSMIASITKDVRGQEEATDHVRVNAESLLTFSETVKQQIAEQAERSNQIIAVISLARTNSESYAQASKTLSQLGKYLTVGVDQLKRILTRYVLDSSEVVLAYHRSAPRFRNVYSLEIMDKSLQHEIGYLDDLSLTGLRMLTAKTFYPGQTLEIAILPSKVSSGDQKPCALSVEVRWVEGESNSTYRQAGLRILDATPANRERLGAFIEEAKEMQASQVEWETGPESGRTMDRTEDVEDIEDIEALEELDE